MPKPASTLRDAGILRPPRRRDMFREWRVLADLWSSRAYWLAPPQQAHIAQPPVIVFPGFGSGDWATRPLRRFLAQHGYASLGWGLGVNRAGLDIEHGPQDIDASWMELSHNRQYRGEGSVPLLCQRARDKVRQRSQQLGQPVHLVGGSLGGFIAREVARDIPHHVHQVITLGSPVQGGPKYTAAASLFRQRGQDLDWIEESIAARDVNPIQVPITAIISPSDAIVSPAASRDDHSPRVQHIEHDAAHLGLGFNPGVWQIILEQLDHHGASSPPTATAPTRR